jgi:hypothetical protein
MVETFNVTDKQVPKTAIERCDVAGARTTAAPGAAAR